MESRFLLKRTLLLFFGLILCNTLFAVKYYVNDGSFSETGSKCNAIGATSNNGKSISTPAATIQQVVNAYTFLPGDTIFVDPGNYNSSPYKNKDVKLNGINGLVILGVDPQTTIIDYKCDFGCNGIVLFTMTNCNNITISNLTLKGYHSNSTSIGDLLNISNSSGVVVNNVSFGQNFSSVGVQSIMVNSNSSAVFNGVAFGCMGTGSSSGTYTTSRNGAMFIGTSNVDVTINNSVISDNNNTLVSKGAGIYISGSNTVVCKINGTEFSNNVGHDGAAIAVDGTGPFLTVKNSCFVNNTGDSWSSGYGGAVIVESGKSVFQNCTS